MFEHPTPTALAEHVLDELALDDTAETDDEEARVRRLLAAVPLDRLRSAGMLDGLLALAGDAPGGAPDPSGTGEDGSGADDGAIDEMDLDDLVQAALDSTGESD